MLRWLIPVTDIPRVRFVDGLITYLPGQTGVFRIENEHSAAFRINRQGWNSAHDHYPGERNEKYRIAIIGDSYVAAAQVDYRRSLAEMLERELGADRVEVFRFGVGGAPMSQYLQMLRHVMSRYSPDSVIVVLAHNDFVPSYRSSGVNVSGRYGESLLTYRISGGAVVGENAPVSFSPTADWISQLATVRYVYYQHRLKSKLQGLLSADSVRFEANIDVDSVRAQAQSITAVILYTFEQLKLLATTHDANLLVVMDGNRALIHDGGDAETNTTEGVLFLNRLAGQIAGEHGITFLDLHPVFENDYRRNSQKLNFDFDGHWNAYAHELVGKFLADTLSIE